jgi:hypothetical protein
MTGVNVTTQGTNSARLSGLANLNLIVECGPAQWFQYEVAGKDVGATPAGWVNNFVVGTLTLGGSASGSITMVNYWSNNSGWSGAEALYVNQLNILPGARVNLKTLNLYYLNGGSPKQLFMGDSNLDGRVDATDFAAWFNNYGSGTTWQQANFKGTGVVDASDFACWYNNYGVGSTGSVPEPAALSLLAIGALAVLRRRIAVR